MMAKVCDLETTPVRVPAPGVYFLIEYYVLMHGEGLLTVFSYFIKLGTMFAT